MKKVWTAEHLLNVRLLQDDKYTFQNTFLKYLYRYMFREDKHKPWDKISTCYDICKMIGEGNTVAFMFWMKLNKFQKDRFCTAAEMWQGRMYRKGTPVETVVFDGKVIV